MEVKQISIKSIKPYQKNAKLHSNEQIRAVANSIKKFGWQQPIVIDKNNEIIIGHCRFEAAKTLGEKTVPCVIADDLSEEEVKALRLADNKTNESEWDIELLNEEIRSLADGIDLTQIGFSIADIIMADDSYEPEGLDFFGEDEYVDNAESQLKAKQVVITYKTEAETKWLMEKLNTESLSVVYQARQIPEEG